MNPKDAQTIKHLQTRKTQIKTDLQHLNKEAAELRATIETKQKALAEVDRQLNAISRQRPILTEHAMLRYVERIKGINLREIATEILNPETINAIETLSSGKIPFKNNLMLIVKNRTIVSIVPKEAADERFSAPEQNDILRPAS